MTALHTGEYRRFATALAQVRRDAGVSQRQLAARLGVDQAYISKYESGRRRLDVIEFLRITAALGADYRRVLEAADQDVRASNTLQSASE